jgi:hypothetical protein
MPGRRAPGTYTSLDPYYPSSRMGAPERFRYTGPVLEAECPYSCKSLWRKVSKRRKVNRFG